MIKLAGICILFLSARIFYENYISKNDGDIKKAEDMMLFANLLYVNVMELKMPLELGILSLKFKISPYIDNFADKVSEQISEIPKETEKEIFLKAFSKLDIDRKIKKELSEFFKILGMSDKDTVLSYKNIALDNCEKYILEYKKKCENKRKTAGAISFGLSAVITIILI